MVASNQRLGVLLILFSALFFGLLPSAARLAYGEGANPLFGMLSRAFLGVLVLLVFIYATGRKAGVSWVSLHKAWLAGVSHTVSAVGLFAAIVYIDISLATIIMFMYPFPVALVTHLRGETPLTARVLGLMLTATLGMALVLGVSFASLDPRGIALAALTMIAFAAMVLSMTTLTREVGAPNSNLLMTIWSLAVFAIVAAVGPSTGWIDGIAMPVSAIGWFYILLIGLSFSIGYLCFFVGAQFVGAARASLLGMLEPVAMILCALAIVGESLNALQWLGVLVMISSLTLTEVQRA